MLILSWLLFAILVPHGFELNETSYGGNMADYRKVVIAGCNG
jgi:hypothetical protein